MAAEPNEDFPAAGYVVGCGEHYAGADEYSRSDRPAIAPMLQHLDCERLHLQNRQAPNDLGLILRESIDIDGQAVAIDGCLEVDDDAMDGLTLVIT